MTSRNVTESPSLCDTHLCAWQWTRK